jgi:CAAX protease family protein
MPGSSDPKDAAIRAGVYLFLLFVPYYFAGWLISSLAGYLLGATMSIFVAAWLANHLAVRIFEQASFQDIGLYSTPRSWRNFGLGVAGGAATAALVLGPALAAGAAKMVPGGDPKPDWSTGVFVMTLLFIGAAGEEIAFHGYAFQVMLRSFGTWGVVFAFGAFFAVMHGANPNSTWLALANTAGFGVLFGYAFLRSRDLWLPIGLHFGWNLSLPLFGVNMSGFTMRVTDYTMQWSAAPIWSGGEYGPEGSLITSIALVFLFLFLWRAPVAKQVAPLAEPSRES